MAGFKRLFLGCLADSDCNQGFSCKSHRCKPNTCPGSVANGTLINDGNGPTHLDCNKGFVLNHTSQHLATLKKTGASEGFHGIAKAEVSCLKDNHSHRGEWVLHEGDEKVRLKRRLRRKNSLNLNILIGPWFISEGTMHPRLLLLGPMSAWIRVQLENGRCYRTLLSNQMQTGR